jgi:hypothetical protein
LSDQPATALRIHEQDNVAVMTSSGTKGQPCVISHGGSHVTLTLVTDAPFGHKVAIAAIPKQGPVLKYGIPIALAKCDIAVGEHVHVHNVVGVKSNLRG